MRSCTLPLVADRLAHGRDERLNRLVEPHNMVREHPMLPGPIISVVGVVAGEWA